MHGGPGAARDYLFPLGYSFLVSRAMQALRIILPLLLFCGCAAGRPAAVTYNEATDETTFTSPKLLAGRISMSGGLASGHRVMVQAVASCEGEYCKPDEVELAFLNDTSSDLNLDYRRIAIGFAGRTVDWEDLNRFTEPAHYTTPRGEFIRIPLTRGEFEMMADAPEVKIVFGLTGTTVLRMPLATREALREMAESMGRRGT